MRVLPRHRTTGRTRLLIVFGGYAAATWLSYFVLDRIWWFPSWHPLLGRSGGLFTYMWGCAAAFLALQVTSLRGILRTRSVFLWSFAIPTGSGLAFGAKLAPVATQAFPTVLAAGLIMGVIGGLAALWLGDLSQLRRSPRLLISYRTDDSLYLTERIYDSLVTRYGENNVFMAKRSLAVGVDWRGQLKRAIARCDVMLVIIGPGWLDARDGQGVRRLEQSDDPVRFEIDAALALKKPVMPILVDGAGFPDFHELLDMRWGLRELHGATLRPPPDFARDLRRLADSLDNTQRPRTRDSILDPQRRTGFRRRLRVATAVVSYLVVAIAPIAVSVLDSSAMDITDAAVSPDGTRVASIDRGTIQLWNVDTGALEHTQAASADIVMWSPDGQLLATIGGDSPVRIWDAATLSPVRTLVGQHEYERGDRHLADPMSWSPDSTKVALGDRFGTVRVWRVNRDEPIASARLSFSPITTLSWAPDGPNRIAYGSADSTVRVLALSSALEAVYESPRSVRPAAAPATPNIASPTMRDPSLATAQPSLPAVVFTPYSWVNFPVDFVVWSPDGRRLAALTGNSWHVTIHTLTGDPFDLGTEGRIRDVQWSSDSAWISVLDDDIRVLNAATGRLHRKLPIAWSDSPGRALAWSPDGYILAATDDSGTHLWSVMEERHSMDLGRGDAVLVGWAQKSAKIVTRTFEEIEVLDVHTGRTTVCRISVWQSLRQ